MKKEVKITKEEHDAFRKALLLVIAIAILIIAVVIFVTPEMVIYGILIIVAFLLALQFAVFGWVFRLRYQILGPLTRYKADDDESMKLDEIP